MSKDIDLKYYNIEHIPFSVRTQSWEYYFYEVRKILNYKQQRYGSEKEYAIRKLKKLMNNDIRLLIEENNYKIVKQLINFMEKLFEGDGIIELIRYQNKIEDGYYD